MHGETVEQSTLREAREVSRIGGTFESVQENEMPSDGAFRKVFERDDRGLLVDAMNAPNRGEPMQIDTTRPEIGGNRQQMRIAKERFEPQAQTRF